MDDMVEAPMMAEGQADDVEAPEARLAKVKQILEIIDADRRHHEAAFKQMRTDMEMARRGADKNWPKDSYVANITGRLVKQKTAALYAKNPKAIARRRETLDFTVWDENPQTLMNAFQTAQMAMAPQIDPATGAPMPQDPMVMQAAVQAQAIMQDFTQGMQRREQIKKLGKTLEILFAHAMREQKPLDFKMAMKRLVRRTCTTGVGYIELGFIRETGRPEGYESRLADIRARLEHLRRLADEVAEGDISEDDPEIMELEASLASLMAEPEIVLREGLVFDYPDSTKVIPDRLCKSLVGFVGARHLTIEYLFTPDEVEEMFPGVDLKKGYTKWNGIAEEASSEAPAFEPDRETDTPKRPDMVQVFKHYDKPSGLVYYVARGYKDFLREPAAPDVYVEEFWPVFALTFNDVESEETLFPPSDVSLLKSMQDEYNRARQGMREHRKAARPRFFFARGAVDEGDENKIASAEAFTATPLNLPPDKTLNDILQALQIPGVDPNLYETGPLFSDVQLTVGVQEANLGSVAKATATEAAIASNSMAASDQASVDDLDAFLTCIARASGVILLREMSEEQVKRIVGPGAVWPQMTLADIAGEIFLEVEAGSSGKPHQAVEIENWAKLAPTLTMIPNINPVWIAKETVKRLDDRIDLNEAVIEGIPSIVAQNAMTSAPPTMPTGDPNTDPASQGAQGAQGGADKTAAQPMQQPGSEPAFGSNQTGARPQM